jgi:hypothetical protein
VGFFKKGKDEKHGGAGGMGAFSQLREAEKMFSSVMGSEEIQGVTTSLQTPEGFRQLTGTVDPELMQNGVLGQAIVISVQETGTSVGSRHDPRPVCDFEVQVRLDNSPPFTATVRQSVQLARVQMFVPGQTMVAVRVDPNDHTRVAIDFSQEPPSVTIDEQATGQPTAASVLMTGMPVRAVIVQSQPLNAKTSAGVDLYALLLTVLQEGQAPRQLQLGYPVPAGGIPLLYPGSNVPAKALPDRPDLVAIDWDAAVSEASR